jgi:hypothetical protein
MKYFSIVLLSFISISAFSQFEGSGILISTNVGIINRKSNITSGFALNPSPDNTAKNIDKSLNVHTELSYVVNSKFMGGIGYFINNSSLQIENISSFVNNGTPILTTSRSTAETRVKGVSFHVRYSQEVVKKLIFSLKLSFLPSRGETEISRADSSNLKGYPNTSSSIAIPVSFNELRISPSIHYFIGEKWGCYAEILGLNALFNDSREYYNETRYNLDFNPSNWRLGVFYNISFRKN